MHPLLVGALVIFGVSLVDRPERARLPWVHGLNELRFAAASPLLMEPGEGAPTCGSGGSRSFTLRGELTESPGREAVTASYSDGIVIRARDGRLLYSTPGHPCEGSADELEAVALGRIDGEPMLVVVATSGGHHESATTLALYRPGVAGQLNPVFTALVESRSGDRVSRGGVWLAAGHLLYRPPTGGAYSYNYVPVGNTYFPAGRVDREVVPHVPSL